jgi:outer membrane protein
MTRTISIHTIVAAAACTVIGLGSNAAQAQVAGSVLVRAGVTSIQPHTSSGNLSAPSLAGTQIDVGSANQLSGGITYMVSDNMAIDIPLALPFKHEVKGAGAIAGTGKIAEVQALPMTLLAQYRFGTASTALRPYVGGGLTYAKFFKERTNAAMTSLTGGTPANPTTMKVDSKLATTLQMGVSLALDTRWSVDASYTKTLLKTTATLSTGQTIDMKLDPSSLGLGLGCRF